MTLFSLSEHSATSATSTTQLVTSKVNFPVFFVRFCVSVHRYRGRWENPAFGRLGLLLSPIKNHTTSPWTQDINHIKIVVKLLLKEKMMIMLAGKIDERAIIAQ